ncbi:hypothetical protein [Sphingomonas sp. Leaf17]|uniref:hypothetical protein n=1 Tax=Sphingomonas sp. Leaf17 TaxID=1735683 RepID=UPI0012E1077B|nr:hypothetical protein [Sphingomonas sp. Leaf17]
MKTKRLPPAQQGGPDGLCGVYSLINFFRNRSEFSSDRETFRYVFEAIEQLQLLSALHMWDGFEWPKLRAIFDKVSNDWCMGYVAVPLFAVCQEIGTEDIFSVTEAVVADGGEVVWPFEKNGDHWVLVYKVADGEIFMDDSEISEVERTKSHSFTKAALSRKHGLNATIGLALVPTDSKLAKLI